MSSQVARLDDHDPRTDAPAAAAVHEAELCLGHLVRTLKTCRLYDENNPTSIKFREELVRSLLALIERHGTLRLEVGAGGLSWGGQPLHAANARDDNLAGVLHRDGLRVLAFEPGIEPSEVDRLVDLILRVTGPGAGEEDLVTLLWDAELPHLTIETVPLDGDPDEGWGGEGEKGPGMAWPRQGHGGEPSGAGGAGGPGAAPEASRSDDCVTGKTPENLEQSFDRLESAALFEIARFQAEQEAAVSRPVLVGILGFIKDCLADQPTPADLKDLAEFIPRVLHEALGQGDWATAAVTLELLRRSDPEWTGEALSEDLCGAHTITTKQAVAALDRQGEEGVASFLALARAFGTPMAEWLMHVVAESQQRRVRRPLARTIGELLVGKPEAMIPWLGDPRWFVVRNAVHILGWIGGDVAPLLQTVAGHAEPRVRAEVVSVLGQGDPAVARPILLGMLEQAESDIFARILHQLSSDSDPAIAERLFALLHDPDLRHRSDAERRALFLALASRGEAVLAALEEELVASTMFGRRPEPDRPAIALCIARIGTPEAVAILRRGLQSRNGAVRKACLIAGATRESEGEAADG